MAPARPAPTAKQRSRHSRWARSTSARTTRAPCARGASARRTRDCARHPSSSPTPTCAAERRPSPRSQPSLREVGWGRGRERKAGTKPASERWRGERRGGTATKVQASPHTLCFFWRVVCTLPRPPVPLLMATTRPRGGPSRRWRSVVDREKKAWVGRRGARRSAASHLRRERAFRARWRKGESRGRERGGGGVAPRTHPSRRLLTLSPHSSPSRFSRAPTVPGGADPPCPPFRAPRHTWRTIPCAPTTSRPRRPPRSNAHL